MDKYTVIDRIYFGYGGEGDFSSNEFEIDVEERTPKKNIIHIADYMGRGITSKENNSINSVAKKWRRIELIILDSKRKIIHQHKTDLGKSLGKD